MRRTAYVVVGLGYGDEGKGSITDHLVRDRGARLVVRFNGGAQAGHRVVLPDGREHVFSQFGSGTFAGARTLLSHHVLVNPITMESEAKHLAKAGVADPMSLMTVCGDALVTTPFHVAANRLRELARDEGRHGSCGMGIGETVIDSLSGAMVLRFGELTLTGVDRAALRAKLTRYQQRKCDELRDLVRPILTTSVLDRYADAGARSSDTMRWLQASTEWQILRDENIVDEIIDRFCRIAAGVAWVGDRSQVQAMLRDEPAVVFEGAQGVLLDQDHGFHPHTTWSRTTFANALELLENHDAEVRRIGVTRSYQTRHGRGPFVSEDNMLAPHLTARSMIHDGRAMDAEHNRWGTWQEGFRTGSLDVVATRYAIEACGGVDGIAVTHADWRGCDDKIALCVAYRGDVASTDADLISVDGDGLCRTIVASRSVDLIRQERITDALKKMRPVVRDFAAPDPLACARVVAEHVGAPLAIVSHGLTHEHKSSVDGGR